MSEHTPGPWMERLLNNEVEYDVVGPNHVDDDGEVEYIAIVYDGTMGDTKANARLIAAAPDLLAALEEITQLMLSKRAQTIALAAIARAKGGEDA